MLITKAIVPTIIFAAHTLAGRAGRTISLCGVREFLSCAQVKFQNNECVNLSGNSLRTTNSFDTYGATCVFFNQADCSTKGPSMWWTGKNGQVYPEFSSTFVSFRCN
ncbi:uncharacterized protein L3040_004832 [Drepanopeziza brunnea f. sp. 'multigermtubi']|uniref:uncharacterized protein n=1 Tax=Drepanopeziza brunnea f. sp. 'multigermtubi' TaxID=698441 RepID=UPI00238D9B75|nr:hypothetical protein L3040_004832 [Drepanopeziza brunnea f. sp. 'multigermtubi']